MEARHCRGHPAVGSRLPTSKARSASTSARAGTKKAKRPSALGAGAPSAREALRRSPALPFDVVESKVHVPALRSGTVSRPALVNRLRATSEPIALLTAPAGYGKTTVLAQWAARDSRPFAWISVDERDNDPLVLLRHVAFALNGVERIAPRVFDALAVPGSSIWKSAVPRLGSALAAFGEPVVLVLDDTHLLRSREGFDAVWTLAQHAPEGSLLVARRAYPPETAGRCPPRPWPTLGDRGRPPGPELPTRRNCSCAPRGPT